MSAGFTRLQSLVAAELSEPVDPRVGAMAAALGASAAHAVTDADLSFRTRHQATETRDRLAGA